MNLHPLPLACLLGLAAATAARTADATDAAQASALPAVQVRAEAAAREVT